MKKKVMGIIAVVAVAAVAGYNVYAQDDVKLSDLTLNNIEALASSNEASGNYCRMNVDWYCLPWGTGIGCYCYL